MNARVALRCLGFILTFLVAVAVQADNRRSIGDPEADLWDPQPTAHSVEYRPESPVGPIMSSGGESEAFWWRLGDFMVNDDTSRGDIQERHVSVAASRSGRSVVAWTDRRTVFDDYHAQRLDSMGQPIGPHFKVNPGYNSCFAKISCDVGMDPEGNFLIVWTDGRLDYDGDIHAQRFESEGDRLGEDFRVSEPETLYSDPYGRTVGIMSAMPAVAMTSNGDFVVCWVHGRSTVVARRFSAGGTAMGPQFRVDEDTTGAAKWWPRIVMAESGAFHVAWEDERNRSDEYHFDDDIFLRSYGRDGNPVGPNVQVSDDTVHTPQWEPDIALGPDGDLVVAWEGRRDDLSDVYFQVFDSSLVPRGPNIRWDPGFPWIVGERPRVCFAGASSFTCVADFDSASRERPLIQRFDLEGRKLGAGVRLSHHGGGFGGESFPAVAYDGNGRVMAAWTDYRYPPRLPELFAHVYDSLGSPVYTDQQITDDRGVVWQYQPVAGGCPEIGFVVCWVDQRDGYLADHIFAQRYDTAGQAIGANYRVDGDGGRWCKEPDIALSPAAGAMFVWQDERESSSRKTDIYARRQNLSGDWYADDFRVNDDEGDAYQNDPSVAADPLGDVVVVWEDTRNGLYNDDIFAQRFAGGSAIGSNFRVNDDAVFATQGDANVAMDALGNFVVTWWDKRGGSAEIYAQRYNASGLPLGTNFQVNDVPEGTQGYHDVARTSDGAFFVSWSDARPGAEGIYGQAYESDGTPIGTNVKISEAVSYRLAVSVASDGVYLVTWQDHRYEQTTVSAQRINRDGVLLGTNFLVPQEPEAFGLEYSAAVAHSGTKALFAWQDNRAERIWDIFARLAEWPSNGDLNDDGRVSLADIIRLVEFLYRDAPALPTGSGDLDCSGGITLRDVVVLVNYVLRDGDSPGCP